MKRRLARFLACTLAVLLILPTNITALAVTPNSNVTSNGGSIDPSSFNIHARGYILTLVGVNNVARDNTKVQDEIEKRTGKWTSAENAAYTEAGYSTIQQYYGKYPDFFTQSDITQSSALIALCDSDNKVKEFNEHKHYFIDGSGARSTAWRESTSSTLDQTYAVRRGTHSSTYIPKLYGDDVLSSTSTFDLWKSGYKNLVDSDNTKWEYTKWYKANKSRVAAEAAKFLELFKDEENLAKNLQSILKTGAALDDDDNRWENTLRYLDVLIVVNYLTGNKCTSIVKSYLTNRNMNDSSQFATVFVASTASHSGNEVWDWYTLPTYYAMATGKAYDKYLNICIDNSDVGKGDTILKMGSQSTDDAMSLQQKLNSLFTKYKEVCPDILGSAYQYKMNWANSSLIWWSKTQYNNAGFDNWKMATMLMPTNVFGKAYGNTGYTYFSDAFVPKPNQVEIAGTVSISRNFPVEKFQEVASKGNSVENVLNLSLKTQSYGKSLKADVLNDIQSDVLNSDELDKFDVVIELTAEPSKQVNGSYTNNDYFDKVDLGKVGVSPYAKYNSSDTSVKIVKAADKNTCQIKYLNQTQADWSKRWNKIFNDDGKAAITIVDKVDSVDGFNVLINYKVTVKIEVAMKNGKKIDNYFIALGEGNYSTNGKATVRYKYYPHIAFTQAGCVKASPTITPTPVDKPDVDPSTEEPGVDSPSVTQTPTPTPSPTPIPEIMQECFYTSGKTPMYVEMKEGTPGHETFEAMAGVPTTEDLYVGFGGSEFMLSFDGEEKMTESNDNREYQLTYTVEQCAGTDENCVYSCPGHKVTFGKHNTCPGPHTGKYHSCSNCGGGSVTVYCNKPGTTTYKSANVDCPGHTVTITNTGKTYSITVVGGSVDIGSGTYFGAAHTECISKIDGRVVATGEGCMHEAHLNSCHTHKHTFTGKVTQPIDEFKYFNIKALWLWQLTQCKVAGMDSFMDLDEITIDPETGYQVFCNQEDYRNNNGRLVFSFVFENKKAERFKHTSNSKTDSKPMVYTDSDKAATDWFNEQVVGKTVVATVISDYAVLTTTQGYQSASYHQYDSDEVLITSNTFEASGSDASQSSKSKSITYSPSSKTTSKAIAGDNITFSEPFPTWEELWKENTQSASSWSVNDIVASGYNGDYANYRTKWNHKSTYKYVSTNPAEALLTDQPNMSYGTGSKNFVSPGFSNLRLTKTGLNIRDANPTVSNGMYSVDAATATFTKVVDFEEPEYGIDWAADDGTAYEENDGSNFTEIVGYSPEHEDINSIVVHTPVSTQYAVVVSNDKQYDCRTSASLADGGDPPSALDGRCPMNESCSHAVLVCDNHGELHDESCYSIVQTGTNHVGGINAHVCDKWCNVNHVHTSACYKTTQVTSVSFPFTYGNYTVTSAYSSTFTIDPNATYTIYRHPSGCTYAGRYHLYNSSTGACLGCSHSSCGGAVVATFKGSEFTRTVKTCGLYDAAEMKCTQCNGTGSVTTPGSSAVVTVDSSSGSVGTCGSCGSSVGWYSYTIKCMRCGATASGGGSSHYCGNMGNGQWTDSNGNPQWSGGSSAQISHIGGCDGNYLATTKTCTACNGTGKNPAKQNCSKVLNTHKCTAACTAVMGPILTCCDPHHHAPNEPWDYNKASSHYPFGDLRCYEPCGDDEKHKDVVEVRLSADEIASLTDIFVNVDREMYIYFPDIGDFAQAPTLHGIGTVSTIRGMGYVDHMDTTKYTRNKFVTLPMHVLWYASDGTPQSFAAGEMIDLSKLTYDSVRGQGYYKFYVPLVASEVANGVVKFNSIAVNGEEDLHYYRENNLSTNRDRASDYTARHTAYKTMYVDVLGTIGSLAINDTGDFRFSTLFKHALPTETNGWLIDGIIPNVSLSAPNKVAADIYNARRDIATAATQWHDTYGTLYKDTGGKAHQPVKLPLSIEDANLSAVENQQLKPGYKIYMDVETVGNYYGENVNENGDFQDTKLLYKMQITPRYWELNLDTGVYTPVDVYMQSNNQYVLISDFDDSSRTPTDWYYYVDWTEEARRRNYFSIEENIAIDMQTNWSPTRIPVGKDVIGTASRLFLNDLNRTFIGSEFTYGVNRNPNKLFDERSYARQAQRWHFTLGLPSSTVFVYSGQQPVSENFAAMQSHNAVIVCAINILVKGNVWTLEYDGTGINQSSNLVANKSGKTYGLPIDPITGQPIKDPIIMMYDNKTTAKDDLTSQGSH